MKLIDQFQPPPIPQSISTIQIHPAHGNLYTDYLKKKNMHV